MIDPNLLLEQAHIFCEIFQRELIRFKYGSQNQLPRATLQLRACLDRVDEIREESNGTRTV